MKKKRKLNFKRTMNMPRIYTDRDSYGPDFDDRLIQLVRENPAIYDVNHPHYRRNQVRIAIWERIAYELSAPSKFVQTKWKNIRYNYLQELKSQETGIVNANVRKRRFTEDLSFLQNTAQTYNMRKVDPKKPGGDDNDNSNSYKYPDNNTATNSYEVIEIEHSDDGSTYHDDELFEVLNAAESKNSKELALRVKQSEKIEVVAESIQEMDELKIQLQCQKTKSSAARRLSPAVSLPSSPSSPLLTPLVVLGNGLEVAEKKTPENVTSNGMDFTRDEKIESSSSSPPHKRNTRDVSHNSSSSVSSFKAASVTAPVEIMENAARRKSLPAPFPVLTPINDPIELYCLSLVDSLRCMPRSERERVKYEFAKILKDAKYNDES